MEYSAATLPLLPSFSLVVMFVTLVPLRATANTRRRPVPVVAAAALARSFHCRFPRSVHVPRSRKLLAPFGDVPRPGVTRTRGKRGFFGIFQIVRYAVSSLHLISIAPTIFSGCNIYAFEKYRRVVVSRGGEERYASSEPCAVILRNNHHCGVSIAVGTTESGEYDQKILRLLPVRLDDIDWVYSIGRRIRKSRN